MGVEEPGHVISYTNDLGYCITPTWCVYVCVGALAYHPPEKFLRTRGRTASHASSSRKTPGEKRNEREKVRKQADMLDSSGLQFVGQAD